MATCLIALGSNLGDRHQSLSKAIELFKAQPGTDMIAQSRWYQSAPIGGPEGQGDFLNGAVRLETSLSPPQMLSVLLKIENELGRMRRERWEARTLDLDLLLYDDLVLDTPQLVVPHPRMAYRRFVLVPAAEVAAEMIHPTIGWTMGQLLANLNTPKRYIAIAGPIGAGKTWLAGRLHDRFGGCLVEERLDPEMLADFYADPKGRAWDTETRLLDGRVRQLEAVVREESELMQEPIGPASLFWSDFWFPQSLAFADVWLDAEPFAAFERKWRSAAARVPKPNLLIALDAPTDLVSERIRQRGRPYEQQLSQDQLERLRLALAERVEQCSEGPVLWLDARDQDRLLSGAAAAVAAIEGQTLVVQSPDAD